MSNRKFYKLVGTLKENGHILYILQAVETSESIQVTKEQMAFLIGHEQIINCTGYISGKSFVVRPITGTLKDLPSYENKSSSHTKVRRDSTDTDANIREMADGIVNKIRSKYDVSDVHIRSGDGPYNCDIEIKGSSKLNGVYIIAEIIVYQYNGEARYKMYVHMSNNSVPIHTIQFRDEGVISVLGQYLRKISKQER